MTRKRQKSEDLVSFYLRIPARLKKIIDQEAQKKSCSQAQLVVGILERSLEGDDQVIARDLDAWLSRQ